MHLNCYLPSKTQRSLEGMQMVPCRLAADPCLAAGTIVGSKKRAAQIAIDHEGRSVSNETKEQMKQVSEQGECGYEYPEAETILPMTLYPSALARSSCLACSELPKMKMAGQIVEAIVQ